jgi:hypothetical protein
VQAGGLALTVLSVTNEAVYSETMDLTPNQKFVDVDVVIENDSTSQINYFHRMVTIRDRNNYEYESGIWANPPPLQMGTLVVGDTTRGHVGFILPQNAHNLRLVLGGFVIPGGSTIQIDLGQ